MLKFPFFRNKKSAIEVSLIHLLEIILAIAVAMVLIYFSLKLLGLFLGGREYDSTINNLEALATRVTELVKDNKDSLTQTTVYSITDDYILVGFSYNDNSLKTDCPEENIVSSRPILCKSKSCLCIYQNFGGITDISGKDFDARRGVTPLKCKPFDAKIIFLTPYKDSNFMGSQSQLRPNYNKWPNYNNLVLYGICGGPWKTSWGIRQIFLEKYKESDNIFIIIGDVKK